MGQRSRLKEMRRAIKERLAGKSPADRLEMVKAFYDLGIVNTPTAMKLLAYPED